MRGLALLAWVALVSAQQAPAPQQDLKPGTAILLGRVVEAGSTTGVSGAAVQINGAALGNANAIFTDGTPGGARRVITDGQGQFIFRDLPPGDYSITTTAAGFVPGSYGQTRVIQFARGLDLTRTIEVKETDRLVTATVQMWRMGGISGRVLDEAGEPMVGVPVQILARMTDWGGPTMVGTATAYSDDRGAFHVDVIPGDYVVGVHASTTTSPGSAVQGFLQAMAAGGAQQQEYFNGVTAGGGVLPRGIGTRTGGFHVSQYSLRNVPAVPPMRIEGGREWLYPSTYHPSSWTAPAASVVTVASGEEKSGIDIVMRPIRATRVSGRVLGPSGPLAGIGLRLIVPDPALNRTIPTTLMDNAHALTDAQGEFMFIGIPPGVYTLRAAARPSPQDFLWTVELLTVGEEDISGLEIRLQPGARISGRVVFEGGAPPGVDATKTITIQARPVPGSAAALTSSAPSTRPDAQLAFSLTSSLPAGPYMLFATATMSGWYVKSVTSRGQDIIDRPFELPAGGIDDVVVTLTNRPTRLTGTVRGAEGNPAVSGVVVAVFPTDKSLWRRPGMQSRRMLNVAPDRDGRFSFVGLPAGDYYLVAADWPSREFADADVISALIPNAQRVTLSEAETRHLDLRVVVMR